MQNWHPSSEPPTPLLPSNSDEQVKAASKTKNFQSPSHQFCILEERLAPEKGVPSYVMSLPSST